MAQTVKHLSTMQETWVPSLGREDPLEKGLAIYSSTIDWKTPWTEEPGRLQSMGSQRVRHDWATPLHFTPSFASQESVWNAGDLGSIPGLGRSPGEGKSYPLQYSGLEKSMVTVHGVAKSQTWLSKFHFTPSFVIFLYQISWYLPFFLNDIAQNFLINIMTGPSFFYSDSKRKISRFHQCDPKRKIFSISQIWYILQFPVNNSYKVKKTLFYYPF